MGLLNHNKNRGGNTMEFDETYTDAIEKIQKIKKLKEMEDQLKEKRKNLEEQLFASLVRPNDGKPLHFEGLGKVQWSTEGKMETRDMKVIADRNPELAKRIFSVTYKPKISEISRLERTIRAGTEIPGWLQDFDEVLTKITYCETPKIVFEKVETEEEEKV